MPTVCVTFSTSQGTGSGDVGVCLFLPYVHALIVAVYNQLLWYHTV
jgi:hypothetical protein